MPDRPDLEAWRLFLRSHAAITQALDGELREHCGMPLTWYDVLLTLSEAPGGRLRMQDLADAVLFSRSGLTRLVDRLVAEGFVRREQAESDRRGAFAVLTAAGRRALRRAATVHVGGIERRFSARLDAGEVDQLAAIMARLAAP
jgi:DNA-binding MarR family transcriptional regulator